MNSRLLSLYHGLPSPLRSVAASMRGYYLRAWRYGFDAEERVEQALAREAWSANQWAAWRQERLTRVLTRAATQVPYYRDHWAERRRRGDRCSWETLAHWPLLEKDAVRRDPLAFIASDCDPGKMFVDHTSGTSGKPIRVWLTANTVREWYALFEARCRRWNGVTRHDRWAILGGQLVTPAARQRPPFWVWNKGLNQLYFSAYHLAPHLIPHYLRALVRYRIQYLLGYPSALCALARVALLQQWDEVKMRVVITNAEPLYPHQRELISKAFRCPVRDTYGMAEIAAAGSECEHGRLHPWPEAGEIELLDAVTDAEGVQRGELVCTSLLNEDMPLIRYRVGDRVAWKPGWETCACGRSLPGITAIEGRLDDELYTRDGRAVGRLDPVFKSDLPIREAQIVQESLDQIRVRVVPADNFSDAARTAIEDSIRLRMGPSRVVVDVVPSIGRSANGKLRAVVCNLSPEERALVQGQNSERNTGTGRAVRPAVKSRSGSSIPTR